MSTPWRVSRGARRSSSMVVSRAMATGVVSAVRSSGTPARSASAESSAGPSRPIGDHHARKIAHEQPAQRLRPVCRRHPLEKANLALAENQDAAGAQVFVEARQRQAGFLDVGKRDAAFEAGGAGEQVEIQSDRCPARAEQRPDADARGHVTSRVR